MSRLIACADVGSTFTKVALVDVADGSLLATTSHPTTVDTDVLRGLDAAIDGLDGVAGRGRKPDAVVVCSSAGGGLRLAVVGYEYLVTAEAGRRVGLSAGARVVHVAAGRLDAAGLAGLRAARPDVVLLVGGTDGGDGEVVTHNASRLARVRWRVPVVLAGNADVRESATDLLRAAGVPVTPTDNVLPRIGALRPGPARAAIRDVFLRHVIGGKGLSRGPRFASLVRGATPDIVLTAVEMLAAHLGVDIAAVDVGGATTDVYSVLAPEYATGPTEVAGTAWHGRTVEGDLGVRWGATGVVEAARAERLPDVDDLDEDAARRSAEPGWLPETDRDRSVDARLAGLAATVALRRHAHGDRAGPAAARRDLSRVRLVIGSGGVLRQLSPEDALAVLAGAVGDDAGGWARPRDPVLAVDVRYVLTPAGLLAADYPEAALALLTRHLLPDGAGHAEGDTPQR